jgi:hypothetical protein
MSLTEEQGSEPQRLTLKSAAEEQPLRYAVPSKSESKAAEEVDVHSEKLREIAARPRLANGAILLSWDDLQYFPRGSLTVLEVRDAEPAKAPSDLTAP